MTNLYVCSLQPSGLTVQLGRLQKQLTFLDRTLQEKCKPKQMQQHPQQQDPLSPPPGITRADPYYFSYFPIFAKETLIDTLNQLQIAHVTCNTDTTVACVALAAYLRCPVVADSGDLLLYEFEDPTEALDEFVFLPLRYLSNQPLPMTFSPRESALNVHAYRPSASALHKLPLNLRPFFAVYLQPPSGIIFPLPPPVCEIKKGLPHRDAKDIVPIAVDRVKALITWLTATRSPFEALGDSVRRLDEKAALSFVEQLVSITNAFKIDIDQGNELATYLFPEMLPHDQLIKTSVDLITWLTHQQRVPDDLRLIVSAMEAKNKSMSPVTAFLANAPPAFMFAYRSSLVSPVMLARLFSPTWVLNALMENLNRPPVTDCCRGARYLQYCLTLGFVSKCGVTSANFNERYAPSVSETSRTQNPTQISVVTFHLQPMSLQMASENPRGACASFLREHTGLELQADDDWLESFAFTLCLWHSSTRPDEPFDLLDLPTALSIALLTCSMQSSEEALTIERMNCLADEMATDFKIDVVHEINELQLVYMSALSLVRTLEVMCVSSGAAERGFTLLTFPPAATVFPHSRLIHNLAIALGRSGADRKLTNVWLKKILPDVDTEAASALMVRLLATLAKMSGSVRAIKFDSHSEIRGFPPHNQPNFHQTSPQRGRGGGPRQSLPAGRGGFNASRGNGAGAQLQRGGFRGGGRGGFNPRMSEPRGRGGMRINSGPTTRGGIGATNLNPARRSNSGTGGVEQLRSTNPFAASLGDHSPKPDMWGDFNRRLADARRQGNSSTNPFAAEFEEPSTAGLSQQEPLSGATGIRDPLRQVPATDECGPLNSASTALRSQESASPGFGNQGSTNINQETRGSLGPPQPPASEYAFRREESFADKRECRPPASEFGGTRQPQRCYQAPASEFGYEQPSRRERPVSTNPFNPFASTVEEKGNGLDNRPSKGRPVNHSPDFGNFRAQRNLNPSYHSGGEYNTRPFDNQPSGRKVYGDHNQGSDNRRSFGENRDRNQDNDGQRLSARAEDILMLSKDWPVRKDFEGIQERIGCGKPDSYHEDAGRRSLGSPRHANPFQSTAPQQDTGRGSHSNCRSQDDPVRRSYGAPIPFNRGGPNRQSFGNPGQEDGRRKGCAVLSGVTNDRPNCQSLGNPGQGEAGRRGYGNDDVRSNQQFNFSRPQYNRGQDDGKRGVFQRGRGVPRQSFGCGNGGRPSGERPAPFGDENQRGGGGSFQRGGFGKRGGGGGPFQQKRGGSSGSVSWGQDAIADAVKKLAISFD